jgi:hypothetical protein
MLGFGLFFTARASGNRGACALRRVSLIRRLGVAVHAAGRTPLEVWEAKE